MTKSTKSQQGGLTPSSFRTTGGVHESVARAMRGKCVRHWLMVQVSSFALTTTSTIPRVRTYHTREPSRFVHALSARPLKKRWAGVDKVNALTGQNLYILFCLFAELGLCLVGVGASTTRMVGANIVRPRKEL